LDDYIGGSPFVLLIDELNALAHPLDDSATRFLNTYFLDKVNRYLVFTTHVPMNLESSAFVNSASGRGIKSMSPPITKDLKALRQMPGCGAINAATVALYGGIPSLIYSVCALNEMTPEARFQRVKVKLKIPLDAQQDMLASFVGSVVTGSRDDTLKMFDQFAIATDVKIQWPICYIQQILSLFEQNGIIRFLLDQCGDIVTFAKQTELGKDWECVINISLGFRCLSQHYFGDGLPFKMIPVGVKPAVCAITGSSSIASVTDATSMIHENLATSKLLLMVPPHGSFPEFDGFIAYMSPNGEKTVLGSGSKVQV